MTYPTNVEVKNLGYSLKNIIPIPTKQHYLKYMIGKVESFITRLRWKAYFFEKPDQCNSSNSTNFGFESDVTRSPLSKMDFMIWCDLSNLNQSEIIFNPC